MTETCERIRRKAQTPSVSSDVRGCNSPTGEMRRCEIIRRQVRPVSALTMGDIGDPRVKQFSAFSHDQCFPSALYCPGARIMSMSPMDRSQLGALHRQQRQQLRVSRAQERSLVISEYLHVASCQRSTFRTPAIAVDVAACSVPCAAPEDTCPSRASTRASSSRPVSAAPLHVPDSATRRSFLIPAHFEAPSPLAAVVAEAHGTANTTAGARGGSAFALHSARTSLAVPNRPLTGLVWSLRTRVIMDAERPSSAQRPIADAFAAAAIPVALRPSSGGRLGRPPTAPATATPGSTSLTLAQKRPTSASPTLENRTPSELALNAILRTSVSRPGSASSVVGHPTLAGSWLVGEAVEDDVDARPLRSFVL